VPYAPMYTTDEVPEDPQAKHLQLFVDAVHPAHPEGSRWRTVRFPVSFDGERPLEVTAPPLLGDYNEVLRSGASPWAPRSPK
jgi:crotonobetainyl-CoA:carnitine CoA-transferase CaiB-like acyl-CoA transferase